MTAEKVKAVSIGTKMVELTTMNRAEYNDYRGWDLPVDEKGEDEGYLVEYADGGVSNDGRHAGYISWSPKDVADRHYRPVDGMTFGMAIEAARLGKKLSRKGWNQSSVFIYYVPAAAYPASRNALGTMVEHADEYGKVQYNDYLAIRKADGTVSVWNAGIDSILEDDWYVI